MDPNRAYSLLTVKSYDAEQRTISGIATTPEPDRVGDIVDMEGVSFRNPLPLLLHHDKTQPIGTASLLAATAEGIPFTATLPRIVEPGALQNRIEEAWQSIKAGILLGVSIGFRPMEGAIRQLKSGGYRFLKSEIFELSLVTIPSNAEATIRVVKELAAMSGDKRSAVAEPRRIRGGMSTKEQIQQLSNARAPKVARMSELMTKAAEDNTTLDTSQAEEYDGLQLEVKSIDADLVRLRALEDSELAAATAITAKDPQSAAAQRSGVVVSIKPNVEKGAAFVRYAMALLSGRGDSMRALEFAKRFKDTTPEVELMVKAAVAPGDTLNPSWAGALVQMKNAQDEFLALLRPATIIGKVAGLRKVPFNTQVPVQTGGGTYAWVGQGAAKPVGKLALTTVGLGFSKAAGIIVITVELAKLSTPSAEDVVRGDMIGGMAAFLDSQFIDPAVALVANVSPASITNGAGTAASTNNPYTDLHKIASYFATNNIPLAGMTLIMSETNALSAGMARDAKGNKIFPGLGASGGTAEGFNVVASNAAGTNVIGVHPQGILYADEGGVEIDVSTQASVMMDSAPVPGTTAFTSLWQNNLIGLRAERMINWNRARPNSVYYLTAAAYVPTGGALAAGESAPPA